jgi:hypothetical protein
LRILALSAGFHLPLTALLLLLLRLLLAALLLLLLLRLLLLPLAVLTILLVGHSHLQSCGADKCAGTRDQPAGTSFVPPIAPAPKAG